MPKLTLSFKGKALDVFHLEPGESLVGRDEACAIHIDSLAIAPIHARVLLDDEGCHLESMDPGYATLVNHNIALKKTLHHGDVIQIGKHTLSYAEDAAELTADIKTAPATVSSRENTEPAFEEEPQAQQSMLQIMNGSNFGRIIPLTRNMTRLGRAGGDCAMIARRDSGYYISYLEGPNSPIVNKHPIGEESQLLKDGDIIEVGNTEMQFHS
jgi:hypothetical protein